MNLGELMYRLQKLRDNGVLDDFSEVIIDGLGVEINITKIYQGTVYNEFMNEKMPCVVIECAKDG